MLPPIVSWGEVLWDRYPGGAVIGGAPSNVAWHLAMLGSPIVLASRVGDDAAGREAVAQLAARGVDTSLIQIDPERGTGEVAIQIDERGEPRYRLVPERAWERIEATPAAIAALARAPAVVFGTLSQRALTGLRSWRTAMTSCGATTIKVLDPNLRPAVTGLDDQLVLAEALAAADVVKIGERELELCERRLDKPGLLDWLLGERSPPARLVAVTRGPAGSTLHTAHERVEAPALPAAPGGDNVGCGDAYVAVLVHALLSGWSLGELAAVASRWTAAVASVRGATPDFDAETIARLTADRVVPA